MMFKVDMREKTFDRFRGIENIKGYDAMTPPVATADERGSSLGGHALANRLSFLENITSK